MNKYIITEAQVNSLAQILGEIPAKLSMGAIDLLRSLEKLEEKVDSIEANIPQ